ncbi:alpha/beta fold hydrolase [Sphingopyxis sp. MWB1]|uniref:alpha/beta fold hydrolase n=1 Tax=Sphingopyxis sp. MWB1 TaxID=1537715 RepID=UPI00068EAD26|nr:alpha/beta fold hydrolase [Sphingopyxis sp. MWB1]
MRSLLAVCAASLLAFAAPASAQQVGSLVSADPVTDTPPGMQAWRIRYWTSNGAGARQEVTGMVVAPREAMPRTPRRVIAWAHGTSGVAEKCAPSNSPGFYEATPGLAEMIAQNYVVVAPDYPGLGSKGPHPYLIGVDTAYSVLDAVRAARSVSGAAAGDRFAVWGESQGGHAALWTAATARGYAPDLTLVGTAAAAPPTDLPANMRQASDANARAMLLAFTLYSWSQYFGYSLDGFTNKTNQGVIRRLSENNCIELHNKPKLGTILGILAVRQAMKRRDVTRLQPFAATMQANSVDPASVPGPLLIAQGSKDTIVAPAVTRSFAKAVCKRRTPLQWIEVEGGSHTDSARGNATGQTLDWITARFNGQAPPDDCGRF